MKYWWGYLVAAVFAGFSWVLMQMGEKYSQLVDMVYPYVTRSVQSILCNWTGTIDILLWQVVVVTFVVVALAALVLLLIFKGNIIRYIGWILAVVSIVFFLHTGVYGLNYYAGPIADDIRMPVDAYTQSELELATEFYRDKAGELADQLSRESDGSLSQPDFEELAQLSGNGFEHLVKNRSFSVFAGDLSPVKKLGWSDMYTSMGITGFTCFLTGEAAVNPQIPIQVMPFTMCHEMAHRMSIAKEDDANFAGFLACEANEDVRFRYSGYFMAFRYCFNALYAVDAEAATEIKAECSDTLLADLEDYNEFFRKKRDEKASKVADTVNDSYLKVSGDADGIRSSGAVCDQLVNGDITEYATPEDRGEEQFDPYDETQVDLSGNVHYVPPATEEAG